MSIHFISGKPGGGKSLYATKLVFEELCFGKRHIVTNLALRVGELNHYYQENHGKPETLYRFKVTGIFRIVAWLLPDWLAYRCLPIAPELVEQKILQPKSDNICERVHLISDEEMSTFFCHRPDGHVEHISNADWKTGKRPDYTVVKDHGVFFCLDEVHIAFNSRAWAETGAEVLYYLSQHRKLGDDVICVTQSVANVDKQFRSVAQDFTYIRNLGKEKAGLFRLPLRFVRKTYSQPPTGNISEPMDFSIFSLDVKGLAACYDTAKGVGIHGRGGADTKERKKGFHWAYFVIGVPLLLILFLHYSPKLIVHVLSVKAPAANHLSRTNTTLEEPAKDKQSLLPSHSLPIAGESFGGHQREPQIFCTGWVLVAGNGTAFMSDGTSYSSEDHEIDWIKKRTISILGKVYDIRPANPPAAANPVSPSPQIAAQTPRPQFQTQIEDSNVEQPQNIVVAVIPNRSPLDMARGDRDTTQNAASEFPAVQNSVRNGRPDTTPYRTQ